MTMTSGSHIRSWTVNKFLHHFLLVTSCVLLGGCASYSGISPELKQLAISQVTEQIPSTAWPKDNWWVDQHDPVLSALIERALQDSPNLQAASARLTRVRAISGQAESALWPQVSIDATITRERFTENGLIPPPYAGTAQDMNDVQLGGQWEIDFFGRNRENLKAALGELRASEAENHAIRVMLASNVARGYYNLARLLTQRELATQRQQIRLDLAGLVERRYTAGLDTQVELEAAHGVVPENARDIAALDEQISIVRHALAVLTGQEPVALDTLTPALPAIAAQALPNAFPADLLGHRADVVAARWRVESATHDRESTQALFYPNIDLRAFTGFSSIGLNQWLDAGSRQPGFGLAVSLPVFDAGRLRNQFRISTANVDAAVAAYNSTLLDALRDVADQLSSLQATELQLAKQNAALDSARHSHELALQRYRAGITDRLTVLNVETALIAQRRTAIDLQGRWIDARIRLIQALGGGFDDTTAANNQTSITPNNSDTHHGY